MTFSIVKKNYSHISPPPTPPNSLPTFLNPFNISQTSKNLLTPTLNKTYQLTSKNNTLDLFKMNN